MRHKWCTVFVFSNHQTECGERWFSVFHTLHYHSTTSAAVILQNSCHPSNVFVRFTCSSLPLCSASSIDSSSAANRLYHRNTVVHGTDKSPNTFTNISHIFIAVNSALWQNFIAAHCSKCFTMVLYNTSTEHMLLQNTLILPHIDGLTSNLVCRWRRI